MARSRGRRGRPHPYSDGGRGPQPMTKEQARKAIEDGDGRLVPFIRGQEIDAGDLSGKTYEPIVASFTYFGERIRVNPNLTETVVVDLLEMSENVQVGDPRELVAAKDYVREHIHPDDFDDFWAAAMENRQGVTDVITVCWKLLERITDRPTTPPSGSSDGRRDTPMSSPAGASGPVIESEVVPPQSGNLADVAGHFIAKFEGQGRPDLACQIAIAQEAREARGLVTV
jgi:hypothetical protein